jgi:hypothetical protein
LDWTSKIVASKWRNSPPKKKKNWVNFKNPFMKKRGEFLPIFGISVTFCQIFTPKKEKKEKD